MVSKIMEAQLSEIKNGYIFNFEKGTYECLICGEIYEVGQIYAMDNHLYEAFRAIKEHIKLVHNRVLGSLLEFDKKYTGLTEKQNRLLKDIAEGLSDKEIAEKNGIAPATVRHQRFMFREKAKQAKLYLAIYESVENATIFDSKEKLLKPHVGATMVDERYILTMEEQDKILRTYFESGEILKLKSLPAKDKRKIAVFRKITDQFESSKIYTEKELNEILRSIYSDVATIRRYLIEYGFFERTNDCSRYWIKES